MIDMANTAQIATLLADNTMLESMGVSTKSLPLKSSWSTMIECVFALVAPRIQDEWATRDELRIYVYDEISKAIRDHNMLALHSQPQYSAPASHMVMPTQMPITIPQYSMINKLTRSAQIPADISSSDISDTIETDGVPTMMENIRAWAPSFAFEVLES